MSQCPLIDKGSQESLKTYNNIPTEKRAKDTNREKQMDNEYLKKQHNLSHNWEMQIKTEMLFMRLTKF